MSRSWAVDGRCREPDVDPEIFFPVSMKDDDNTVNLARAICFGTGRDSECPVRRRCLKEGMNVPDGIWGGRLPDERKYIRKRRNDLDELELSSSAKQDISVFF